MTTPRPSTRDRRIPPPKSHSLEAHHERQAQTGPESDNPDGKERVDWEGEPYTPADFENTPCIWQERRYDSPVSAAARM